MGNQAKWALGVGAVLVLALALVFWGKGPRHEGPGRQVVAQAPAAPPPEPAPEPAPQPTPPAPKAEPPQLAPPPLAPEPAPEAPKPAPPTLDVVRIDPQGEATVAGRAAATAQVLLRLEGQEMARTTADATGAYASLFTIPPADAPRVLTVAARGADGVEVAGQDRYIVAPFALPDAKVADATTATTDATTMPEPKPEPAPAPQILKQTEQAVAVVTAAPLDNITIDSVTYGLAATQIGGRGAAGAAVLLYLDDAQAASAAIGDDGQFSAAITGLAPGSYTLRADQLDTTGKVTSRYEMEIVKAAPEALAQLAPAPVVIEVDKGTTLWAIAQEHFGDGLMYVQVYAANRDKIRDPDLIYPGQVFEVPVLQMVKQP